MRFEEKIRFEICPPLVSNNYCSAVNCQNRRKNCLCKSFLVFGSCCQCKQLLTSPAAASVYNTGNTTWAYSADFCTIHLWGHCCVEIADELCGNLHKSYFFSCDYQMQTTTYMYIHRWHIHSSVATVLLVSKYLPFSTILYVNGNCLSFSIWSKSDLFSCFLESE